MTDDELRARVMHRLSGLARKHPGYVQQADTNALNELRKRDNNPLFGGSAAYTIPGFIGHVVTRFPDQMKFMRMPSKELKALAKLAPVGSEVWLQCRAAQLYWRVCWLDSQKERK